MPNGMVSVTDSRGMLRLASACLCGPRRGRICMKSSYTRLMVVSAAAAAIVVTSAGSAVATPSVSTTPGNMPTVTSADSQVRKIAQCGSTMYAVGTFTTVGTTTGGHLTRNNAFSFDATTGAVSSWNPDTNGIVDTVAF